MGCRSALVSTFLLLPVVGVAQEAVVKPSFNWPKQGKVEVVEKALRRGHEFEMRYVLSTSPDAESGGLRVALSNFEPLRLDGRDFTEPALQPLRDSLVDAEAIVPAMRIDRNGDFIEFVDLEQDVERMFESMKRVPGTNAETLERMLATVRQPEYLRMLDLKYRETWNIWAGSFTGLALGVGETEETAIEQPSGLGGLALPAVYRRTIHRLFEDRGIDCVELSVTQQVDPGAFARAMTESLSGLEENPVPREELEGMSVERELEIRGVFELATLRPHTVRYELKGKVKLPGKDEEVRHDRRTFEFRWQDLQ